MQLGLGPDLSLNLPLGVVWASADAHARPCAAVRQSRFGRNGLQYRQIGASGMGCRRRIVPAR